MTAVTLRHPAATAVEAATDPTPQFRDRIAARCVEFDATYPRAADLEARVLAGIHRELHGVATLLRGLHSPRRFREAVMGDRHLPLADLCRLATDPTREARAAMKVTLGELASAIGCRLEPLDGTSVDAHEALAEVHESHAVLTAELTRDLRDGRLDPEEARALRPEINAHKAQLAQLESVVARAEEAGR